MKERIYLKKKKSQHEFIKNKSEEFNKILWIVNKLIDIAGHFRLMRSGGRKSHNPGLLPSPFYTRDSVALVYEYLHYSGRSISLTFVQVHKTKKNAWWNGSKKFILRA